PDIEGSLRRPGSLNLRHISCRSSKPLLTSRFVEPEAYRAYINQHPLLSSSLISSTHPGTPLQETSPFSLSCFLPSPPLARREQGLRNLCSLKVLHGTRAIRFLGSVLTRLLAP